MGEPGADQCHTSPTETPLLHQEASITQVLSSGFSPEADGARVVLRGRGLDLVYQRAG
jgi:hypothetical protein